MDYREQENGDGPDKQSQMPVTDMDADQGRVHRATAFFQQQQMPKTSAVASPPLPQRPPKLQQRSATAAAATADPYYDCVPREENVNYIDGNISTFSICKATESKKNNRFFLPIS